MSLYNPHIPTCSPRGSWRGMHGGSDRDSVGRLQSFEKGGSPTVDIAPSNCTLHQLH